MSQDQDLTGRRIVALGSPITRHAVDFPGWGHPNAFDYLLPTPAGLAGTISNVESHGMNPWTRYSVRYDDGTRAYGLVLGRDIQLA